MSAQNLGNSSNLRVFCPRHQIYKPLRDHLNKYQYRVLIHFSIASSGPEHPIDSFNDLEFIIIIIILLVPCNDYSAASRLRKILSDEDIFAVITVNQINVVKPYYS